MKKEMQGPWLQNDVRSALINDFVVHAVSGCIDFTFVVLHTSLLVTYYLVLYNI